MDDNSLFHQGKILEEISSQRSLRGFRCMVRNLPQKLACSVPCGTLDIALSDEENYNCNITVYKDIFLLRI